MYRADSGILLDAALKRTASKLYPLAPLFLSEAFAKRSFPADAEIPDGGDVKRQGRAGKVLPESHRRNARGRGKYSSSGNSAYRLKLPEYAPQLLLDPVNSVKEISPVHAQPPGAQSPVCPQKEVISKQTILEIVQGTVGDQAKIGDILFVFSAPGRRTRPACVGFDRDPAQVFFLRDAANEAVPTNPKNRPQNAIAGRGSSFLDQAQS